MKRHGAPVGNKGKAATVPAVTDVTDLSEKSPPEKKKGGKGSAKKG
jgi:hypothetical protein